MKKSAIYSSNILFVIISISLQDVISNTNGVNSSENKGIMNGKKEESCLKIPDDCTKDNMSLNTSTSNVYFSDSSISKM